jgi:Lar family restriction alleviation protein
MTHPNELAADEIELKPCPFCGGAAEIVHIDEGENEGGTCVCCTSCLASSNIEFSFKENFISNWNRRTSPAMAVKPLEWKDAGGGWYEAASIDGVIRIMDSLRNELGRFILHTGTERRRKLNTLAEAKAAAQADYEQRIRSLASPSNRRNTNDQPY